MIGCSKGTNSMGSTVELSAGESVIADTREIDMRLIPTNISWTNHISHWRWSEPASQVLQEVTMLSQIYFSLALVSTEMISSIMPYFILP